jgi:hypothetical protein
LLTIEIENTYTDGHESKTTVELPVPDQVDDTWWQDTVFEHTGDGHYNDVYEETGERLGSCYTATIVKAEDPALVGLDYEWLD